VRGDRVRRVASTLTVASAALWLAGCGGGAPAARAGSGVSSPRRAVVFTRNVKGLGTIVVDGSGYTLYAYIPDRRGASKCTGHCATEWPPLLLPRGSARPVGGRGVRQSLLGTTRRRHGGLQVTYNRWPLYLYEQDTAPGEIEGQGDTMGLWYVVAADGAVDRSVVPESVKA
jgi:predicted lipoprotein with Yx(FWY)xxD motif